VTSKGILIVISGPSGAGKGTVCRALLEQNQKLFLSVSKTTRTPRAGEQDGVNYFFVSRDSFVNAVDSDDFLEHACVYGEFYGTPRSTVEKMLAHGRDVILEIDTQGALKIKKSYTEGIFIFILPPSADELYRRITRRGTESVDSLKLRMASATAELAMAFMYDYVVVNNSVEESRDCIAAIIRAEKLRVSRNRELIKSIIEEAKE
jgi:guanylate kinase